MRFFGRTRTPWEGDFPLTRRRIYVLPSRMGLIFAGALLVMLVLTINYGLALGYVLVFVLGGVFWVSLFHALVHSIIGQQISTKAQITLWGKMQARFPGVTPDVVASCALDGCGLGGRADPP